MASEQTIVFILASLWNHSSDTNMVLSDICGSRHSSANLANKFELVMSTPHCNAQPKALGQCLNAGAVGGCL